MNLLNRPYTLTFKKPSGTSRGILTTKNTYIIELHHQEGVFLGETGFFKGLSYDDRPNYAEILNEVCANFDFNNQNWWEDLREFPSIQFGIEQALQAFKLSNDYPNSNHYSPILFPSDFTENQKGIPINGLIWMGSIDFMKDQINEKLAQNYHCIKLKIGVDWPAEKEILTQLRQEFPASDLELRVDANGGFTFEEAKVVLQELHALEIHSIEQPIKQGQIDFMAELCATTPTPIALDEELIGLIQQKDKLKLLETIRPQYIILKPSLVGGFKGSQEWIEIANQLNIGWWITSALESNIGLNAIAQWTFTLNNPMPQGLGTGSLFTNNFESRLKVVGDQLFFI